MINQTHCWMNDPTPSDQSDTQQNLADDKALGSAALVAAYKNIATSTIGHFTDSGYLVGVRAMGDYTDSYVGRVITVTLTCDDTQIIRDALIAAQPAQILCIDARVLGVKACWGALRSCAALYERLSGVIVLGHVTDSAWLKQCPLPVFAHGVSAVTTSSHQAGNHDRNMTPCSYQTGKLHQPITYSGTTICSEDIAVMDADGVMILTNQQASSLLPKVQTKQVSDDQKLAVFMAAYHNDTLDQLPL